MRRNTTNWIARIFSIAAAGAAAGAVVAVTTLDACNNEEDGFSDQSVAVDLRAVDIAELEGGPASVRRPFLVGSSMRSAVAVARDDWRDEAPPADVADLPTRRALAAAWLQDGLEEHASIAAFARLSILGLAVGAPSDLIEGAQRASLDEVRHARICFALATRYGAEAAGPGPLVVDDALAVLDLAGLAALNAEEGCVGETLGALLAERQAAVATDPFVRSALTRIAADERRHAELAWRFVAWACRIGGAEVLESVNTAIEHALAATRRNPVRPLVANASLWHAHGRLTCAEAMSVAEEGITTIVMPAWTALRGGRVAA